MNNYTRTPRASRRSKKAGLRRTLLVVCMMLVVMVGSIAGTVAWLTAETDPVTNTFTVGDINITLQEYAYNADTNELNKNVDTVTSINTYKIVPGAKLPKEPFVTVTKGSEPCYIYVSVQNNIQLDNGTAVATLTVGEGWTKVGETGDKAVYKYNEKVDASDEAVNTKPVITLVTISNESVTKENIKQLENDTIVVDAYAHQADNTTEADATAAAIKQFGVDAVTSAN